MLGVARLVDVANADEVIALTCRVADITAVYGI